ncbi:MAG: cobalamin biosynthesis protein CobW, partial [Clostridia bacterium]|nr:cobalamin biosynthesis protein CobW [Clostridia bacterium]
MEGQTDLILVTGFLGAGKTTLIARLLAMYRGERIHLIVNEFGRAAVDGALLAGLGASMDEIVNGSIFCACRLDEFESALDRAQAEGPDRIIVEASGLSDPTAIRYLLERD